MPTSVEYANYISTSFFKGFSAPPLIQRFEAVKSTMRAIAIQ